MGVNNGPAGCIESFDINQPNITAPCHLETEYCLPRQDALIFSEPVGKASHELLNAATTIGPGNHFVFAAAGLDSQSLADRTSQGNPGHSTGSTIVCMK